MFEKGQSYEIKVQLFEQQVEILWKSQSLDKQSRYWSWSNEIESKLIKKSKIVGTKSWNFEKKLEFWNKQSKLQVTNSKFLDDKAKIMRCMSYDYEKRWKLGQKKSQSYEIKVKFLRQKV